MHLTLEESVVAFGPDRWRELEGPEDFPFLRYEWLLAFEQSACLGISRGWIPRFLAVYRGKELIACAPAYIKLNSFGEFVFDQGWADFSEARLGVPYYPKLILAVPFTPATGPRILFRKGSTEEDRALTFDLLSGALPDLAEQLGLSSVHVLFPDKETGQQFAQRSWARRLGIQYQFQNPGLQSFEDYLARFRSKRRAAIRRECRACQEAEICLEVVSGEAVRDLDPSLVHRLYLTTVDKHFYGRRYLTQGFFEQVLRTMPEGIHVVFAKNREGEPLSMAFNLLGSEALYGRYWGTLVDMPFLHFSVCLYEGVRETIRLGRSRFEPGAGGGHKEGRGFVPTITESYHFIKNGSLDLAVRDFCRREEEAVRAHVESAASLL